MYTSEQTKFLIKWVNGENKTTRDHLKAGSLLNTPAYKTKPGYVTTGHYLDYLYSLLMQIPEFWDLETSKTSYPNWLANILGHCIRADDTFVYKGLGTFRATEALTFTFTHNVEKEKVFYIPVKFHYQIIEGVKHHPFCLTVNENHAKNVLKKVLRFVIKEGIVK